MSHGYKNVTVAQLLMTMSRIPHTKTPLCYLDRCRRGLHVDTTAYVF